MGTWLAVITRKEKFSFEAKDNIPLEILQRDVVSRQGPHSGIDDDSWNHKNTTEIFSNHFGESSMLSLTLL